MKNQKDTVQHSKTGSKVKKLFQYLKNHLYHQAAPKITAHRLNKKIGIKILQSQGQFWKSEKLRLSYQHLI